MGNASSMTKTTRRQLGLAAILATFFSSTDAKSRATNIPRVLFVCQYGSVKSAIARELFRQRARERGISVIAVSRGITPEDHVSSELLARLMRDNVNSAHDRLQRLFRRDLRGADIIVVFNPLPPPFQAVPVLDWSDVPSVTTRYDEARTQMLARIDALLDTIARTP